MPNDTSGSYTGPYPSLPASVPVPLDDQLEHVGSTHEEQASEGYSDPPSYSAEVTYAEGALVKDFTAEGEFIFESVTSAPNTNNDPSEDDGTHWKALRPASPDVDATPVPPGGDQPIVAAPGSGETTGIPEP